MNKINKDSIINEALNGTSTNDFVAYLLWAGVGLIASVLIELIRHHKAIKDKGGFSIKFWLLDNLARFLLSIIAIIVGILFSPDVLGVTISNFGAFMAGLVTDKIVEALITLKDKINIGALWKPKS